MTRTKKKSNGRITKNCSCIVCRWKRYKKKEKDRYDKIHYDKELKTNKIELNYHDSFEFV
ncbi:hypothetical protein LCGC14_1561090 [marine sediment metagenome]|uniref:Uncharacterized protein n=1 Tax=marine sediment metagenome TaxID=412755 RepID=A0A0F9J8H1_9ZZZZ|nr:hypothetical protein [bacterium]